MDRTRPAQLFFAVTAQSCYSENELSWSGPSDGGRRRWSDAGDGERRGDGTERRGELWGQYLPSLPSPPQLSPPINSSIILPRSPPPITSSITLPPITPSPSSYAPNTFYTLYTLYTFYTLYTPYTPYTHSLPSNNNVFFQRKLY